ncbi:PHD finger protein 12 [Holothuria leucospilota]|uniref:PHD finger protein 12 n=1 Tax=Holothuria leucospilota TaxID=206669 RepID=A0A9Q1HFM4_HOLLE|nr:PHD finger protein 12 [Holothuria leucospilota]
MTTTVQYDLDTSGGLMDEIQALIAPPLTEEPTRKSRRIEREPRRTGRATNRDCCDSCREGGDLICCDRCPASFHLQCCNPPLEEEQLPTGDWICHKCRVAPEHIEKSDAELIAAMTIPKSITGKDGAKTIERQSGDYFKPRKVPVRLNDRLRRDGKQCMRLAQLQAYKEAQKEMKSGKKEPQDVAKTTSSEPDEDDMEDILQNRGNPFVMLIKAAAIQNPEQFQLPAELMSHAPLPGTTRKRKKEDVAKNYKKIHELENGMVPLPAKVCFHCNKSCRVDPLIQCDYCPLLFHRDCLNPPLTTFPTGRWMCPNHPENGLPEFAKASYTERCKIYHDVNNRLNQHAVKLDFLNKVHATGLPWAEKPTRRKSAEIPSAVKAHYHRPPSLLLQPKDQQHCTSVASLPTEGSSHKLCTPEEQEEWLKTVVGLQSSIALHLTKQGLPKSEQVTQKIVSAPKLFTKSPDSSSPDQRNVHHPPKVNNTSVLSAKSQEFNLDYDSKLGNKPGTVSRTKEFTGSKVETKDKNMENDLNLVNGPRTMWNGPYLFEKKEKYDGHFGHESQEKEGEEREIRKQSNRSKVEESSLNSFKSNGPQEVHTDGKAFNTLLGTSQSLKNETSVQWSTSTSHAGSIQSVSTSLSQNLRVSTITVPSRPMATAAIGLNTKSVTINNTVGKVTSVSLSSSPALISLNSTLQSCLEGSVDAELSKLDEKLIQVLAWQRLQQLMPSKVPNSLPTKDSSDNSSSSAESTSTPNQHFPVLASFCPISSRGSTRPAHVRRRCATIGNNSDADVCLSHYGHCNFSSTRHASVFYDETSRQFELINYSEFGTTVDKVLFTGEAKDKAVVRKPSSSLVKSVRKVSSKRKLRQAPVIVKPEITFLRPCNCKVNNDISIEDHKAGWEGTALLHHGSVIEFGCLQFVFSVTDATLLPSSSKIRL